MLSTSQIKGLSQNLNWPLQDILQNFDVDVIAMVQRHYRDTDDRLKQDNYRAVFINMLHAGG